MSLPSRGAWIEMIEGLTFVDGMYSRSPRGGRGLKSLDQRLVIYGMLSLPSRGAWIEIIFCPFALPEVDVAPLAGGVD